MIIKSLLDLDLYKLSMMKFAYHRYPTDIVKYQFVFRNQDVLQSKINMYVFDRIQDEIESLGTLQLTEIELSSLAKKIPWLDSDFINYLKIFKLNTKNITSNLTLDNKLELTIEGRWHEIILFETMILAIVNECYFDDFGSMYEMFCENAMEKFITKMEKADKAGIQVTEFGTRRRRSQKWQEEIVKEMIKHKCCAGTSNIYLGLKYNIPVTGTQAHEYFEFFQSKVHPLFSQKEALAQWLDEYQGQLGIALTDTIGTEAFLRDFEEYAKDYAGVRHDSGDPVKWGYDFINFYKKMGIDPMNKTFIFSDNLNIDSAIALFNEFNGKMGKIMFGIGTNLTNDVGEIPLNIVIKMIEANGVPVAKISNEPKKSICTDDVYLNYLKYIFKVG